MSDETMMQKVSSALPVGLAQLATQYAANAGMETIDPTDLKRPFYRILQPTSKEVLPGNDKYIDGARVGQIIEGAISKELHSELKIVPLQVIKGYSEFKKQEQGGGFLGFHLDGSERVNVSAEVDYCTKETPEGTNLKRTFQLFVLVDPVGKGQPVIAIIGFTGTAIGEVKKFLSYAMSLGVPLFFKEYTLTTKPKVNQKWNSTTFLPTFNVDKSAFVPVEIAQAAGDIQAKLDQAQLQAMLDATAEETDLADEHDDVTDTVASEMG